MILTRKLALGVAGVAVAGVLGTAGVAAATGDSTPAAALAPTSAAPTSAAPTSAAPTSAAPTSAAPTSAAPTSAAPTSAAPTPDAKKGGRAGHALRARGLHGEWVVQGKDGPVTLVSVRGQVTAVGPTSVTVKAADGYTATFTVNADTKVRGADVKAIADVKVGATGAVVGTEKGNTVTARLVHVRK